MTKNAVKKGTKNMPKKHICARASFLYQAASYLAKQTQFGPLAPQSHVSHQENMPLLVNALETAQQTTLASKPSKENTTNVVPPSLGSQRHLIAHLRAVSLKSQFRLSHGVKRSVCKRCNALLIPGSTSSIVLENKSRGKRKPWADVRVITCLSCGAEKRFPVGATKQASKKDRVRELEVVEVSELQSATQTHVLGKDGRVLP